MRTLLGTSVLVTALIAPSSAAVLPAQMKGSDVSVTVAYTGKGAVDATHAIWVFLFDTPNIAAGARPIIAQAVTKSGGATVFKGITQDPVYVAVAYDDKGGYDGNAGPPPAGTPIAFYSVDGKGTTAPVKTAGGAKIKLTFSDARRMQ
jgi:hypothetical protein